MNTLKRFKRRYFWRIWLRLAKTLLKGLGMALGRFSVTRRGRLLFGGLLLVVAVLLLAQAALGFVPETGSHALGERAVNIEAREINPDFSELGLNVALRDAQRHGASYEFLASASFLWEIAYAHDVNPILCWSVAFAETSYGRAGSGLLPFGNIMGVGLYETPEYLGGYAHGWERGVTLLADYYIAEGRQDVRSIGQKWCPVSPVIGPGGQTAWMRNVETKYNQLHAEILAEKI